MKIMSAKGSLKQARDPVYQALFAIRGVSANVFKLDLSGILANKEFADLIKVLGCNVGQKFDMSKLQFNKIIIASDADVDGLFIRSLLCSFFFKVYPEIIQDGRLFIAEPPLYRIDDKKDPFVINKNDYVKRYIQYAIKDYSVGLHEIKTDETKFFNIKNKDDLEYVETMLTDTSSYGDDIETLAEHYKVNDRLIEMIIEEFAYQWTTTDGKNYSNLTDLMDIQHMLNHIREEFDEMYFDENDKVLKGIIDGADQAIEINERLLRKSSELIDLINKYGPGDDVDLILKNNKTSSELKVSLLQLLKSFKKYQPRIMHRFKGLGENSADDIKITTMDPNTRTLIQVCVEDIRNDMEVFQMLRGSSPLDAKSRKNMMQEFKIDRNDIDT